MTPCSQCHQPMWPNQAVAEVEGFGWVHFTCLSPEQQQAVNDMRNKIAIKEALPG